MYYLLHWQDSEIIILWFALFFFFIGYADALDFWKLCQVWVLHFGVKKGSRLIWALESIYRRNSGGCVLRIQIYQILEK